MSRLVAALTLLAAPPGDATRITLVEHAARYRFYSGDGACEARVKKLVAEKPEPGARTRRDEWGGDVRFDCKQAQVCSAGPDKKHGTKDDLCEALGPDPSASSDPKVNKMKADLVSLTNDFAPGYKCEDLQLELAKYRVGDEWKRLLRVDCTRRTVCSDGPDRTPGTEDDICQPMR